MVDDVNQTTQQTIPTNQSPQTLIANSDGGSSSLLPSDQSLVPQDTSTINDTVVPTTTNNARGGSSGTQNPLDVLEDLLNEIDKGGASGGTGKKASSDKKGPSPEEIAAQQAAEELEKRRIDFEQKQAEQQVIDQEKLEKQRQALIEEMQNGSANVARAQQDEQKKTDYQEKKQAEEGFEIVQLDHTKI